MTAKTQGLGLLIDYEFCTGCHTCEVACKKEHDLAEGIYGIKIAQIGPQKLADRTYEWSFMPIVGDTCDLCEERRSQGKLPLCVQSCQAKVMTFGTMEELAPKAAKKTKTVLFSVM